MHRTPFIALFIVSIIDCTCVGEALTEKVDRLLDESASPSTAPAAIRELRDNSTNVLPLILERLEPRNPRFPIILDVLAKLGLPPEAMATISELYRTELDAKIRRQYLKTLSRADSADAIPVFVSGLAEKSRQNRRLAWLGLSRQRPEAILPHREKLLSAAQAALADSSVAPFVLLTLNKIGPPDGPRYFLPFLQAESLDVAGAAFYCLNETQDQKIIEELKALLYDDKNRASVRALALETLSTCEGAITLDDWTHALRDDSIYVQALKVIAEGALSKEAMPPAGIAKEIGNIVKRNPALWSIAFSALSTLPPNEAARGFEAIARDQKMEEQVRLESLRRLENASTEHAKIDALRVELINNPNEPTEVRIFCLDRMATESLPYVLEALVNLSASKQPVEQAIVARRLAQCPPSARVTRALLNLLESGDIDGQIEGFVIVGLAKAKEGAARDAVLKWIASAESGGSPNLPEVTARVNRSQPGKSEAIFKALLAKSAALDPAVRAKAIESLGVTFKVERILPLMRAWLDDPDEQVALAVVSEAYMGGDPRALPILLAALEDPREIVALSAIKKVWVHKDDRVIGQLIKCLRHTEPEVRSSAALMLSRLTLNILGSQPTSQALPNNELVTEYAAWNSWWEEQGGHFDFVSRYLEVLPKMDVDGRVQVLNEVFGHWARDRRLEKYLHARLNASNARERQGVVNALLYAGTPSYQLLYDLVKNLDSLQWSNVFLLFHFLTNQEYSSYFQPSAEAVSNRKRLQAEYERWYESESENVREWWKKHQADVKENEEQYRRIFLKKFEKYKGTNG